MSTNAVQFGLLALYAEDMYAAAPGTLNPPVDARIAADGWKNVKQYDLFNYILDLVPHVPAGIGYTTLSQATIIQPMTAQAGIRLDLLCDDHVICYCAMLDFQQTSAGSVDGPGYCLQGLHSRRRINRSGSCEGARDCYR